jgi:hypothetical protein
MRALLLATVLAVSTPPTDERAPFVAREVSGRVFIGPHQTPTVIQTGSPLPADSFLNAEAGSATVETPSGAWVRMEGLGGNVRAQGNRIVLVVGGATVEVELKCGARLSAPEAGTRGKIYVSTVGERCVTVVRAQGTLVQVPSGARVSLGFDKGSGRVVIEVELCFSEITGPDGQKQIVASGNTFNVDPILPPDKAIIPRTDLCGN